MMDQMDSTKTDYQSSATNIQSAVESALDIAKPIIEQYSITIPEETYDNSDYVSKKPKLIKSEKSEITIADVSSSNTIDASPSSVEAYLPIKADAEDVMDHSKIPSMDIPPSTTEPSNPILIQENQAFVESSSTEMDVLAEEPGYSQRKVFAIIDDPMKPERGDSTCIFVRTDATLGEALMKLNEQQSIAVWGCTVDFVGITTKNDRFIRGGHLLKSNLDIKLAHVMFEEDYLVVCPASIASEDTQSLKSVSLRKVDISDFKNVDSVTNSNFLTPHMIQTLTPGNEEETRELEASVDDRNGKWTEEEDERLIAGLLKYGTKWSQIRSECGLNYRSTFSLAKRSRRKTLLFRLQKARNQTLVQQPNAQHQQVVPNNLQILQEQSATTSTTETLAQNETNAPAILQQHILESMCVEDPSIYRKRNWSSEEDAQLINGIKKYGQKWTTIYRECNFSHRSLPALAKRARKKSFQALLKKVTTSNITPTPMQLATSDLPMPHLKTDTPSNLELAQNIAMVSTPLEEPHILIPTSADESQVTTSEPSLLGDTALDNTSTLSLAHTVKTETPLTSEV